MRFEATEMQRKEVQVFIRKSALEEFAIDLVENDNDIEVIRIFITPIGFVSILSVQPQENHIREIIIATHSLDFRD